MEAFSPDVKVVSKAKEKPETYRFAGPGLRASCETLMANLGSRQQFEHRAFSSFPQQSAREVYIHNPKHAGTQKRKGMRKLTFRRVMKGGRKNWHLICPPAESPGLQENELII